MKPNYLKKVSFVLLFSKKQSTFVFEILKKKTQHVLGGYERLIDSHKLLKANVLPTIIPYLPPFMSSANSNSFKAYLIYLYQTRISLEVEPLKDHVYTTGVVCQFVSTIN